MTTEDIQIAVYGVELSESESDALRDALAARAAKGGPDLPGALECMLALGVDVTSDDADGFHYNSGYRHALGVVMGESSYADAPKLALKPPSKFSKKFDSECKSMLDEIGIKRRPRGILVEQTRLPD